MIRYVLDTHLYIHAVRSSEGAAGRILGGLARAGLELDSAPRSLLADVLLAASCRDRGFTLVTANARDFARIARLYRGFHFAAPWPAG